MIMVIIIGPADGEMWAVSAHLIGILTSDELGLANSCNIWEMV